VVVSPNHDHLQRRRTEMGTEAFEREARKRNAIEGTISELVRGYGQFHRGRLQPAPLGAADRLAEQAWAEAACVGRKERFYPDIILINCRRSIEEREVVVADVTERSSKLKHRRWPKALADRRPFKNRQERAGPSTTGVFQRNQKL